jgi:phosphohistidine phosphatase
MKLYLVQHARTASKEVDPTRSLTAEGRRDIQKVAEFVKPLNLVVNSLWHSGKTRARQTAEILAKVISVENKMTSHDGLAPNDDVQVIKDSIVSDRGDMMIVGHMPFMAKLASLLMTGSESSGTVAFRQCSIVCLSCEDQDQWQIDWMIIPELLI